MAASLLSRLVDGIQRASDLARTLETRDRNVPLHYAPRECFHGRHGLSRYHNSANGTRRYTDESPLSDVRARRIEYHRLPPPRSQRAAE
jgi:hypothetical protein